MNSTTHNFDAAASPSGADRRPENGTMDLLRVAKIMGADGAFPCRVRDLSSSGFMAECAAALRPGESIALELQEGEQLAATVEWVRQGKFGATLDDSRDVEDLLSRAAPAGQRRRSARFECKGYASLRVDGDNHSAVVVNVSESGMCVALETPLRGGEKVSCAVEGLGRLAGVVRWADNAEAGISFNEPLSYERLARWIWMLHRSRSRAENAA